jgi:hypothetical protein
MRNLETGNKPNISQILWFSVGRMLFTLGGELSVCIILILNSQVQRIAQLTKKK